jgi:hypothetical protein
MASNDLAPLQRIESTRTFSNNARFYAPEHLTRRLQTIAVADRLAVMIDVDALDRSTFAKSDRVMTLALDALSHVKVQVVLVSRTAMDRAAALQRCVPRSWCVETDRAVPEIREQMPGCRVIAVSDDVDLLATLAPEDRGIALTCSSESSNVVMTGEISVRAVLWWLVDLRAKAGMAR